ncbi:MAG: CHRD domain-containing protein, partial [Marinirhabdus sp.]
MNNFKFIFFILGVVGLVTFTSCDEDDAAALVQSFNIDLKAAYTIPTNTGSETGTITMDLFDDNTLQYTITVNGMDASDVLTKAHVHLGDVVTSGSSAITFFSDEISGNTISDVLTLTAEDVATLTGEDVYVNVHSQMSPSGLVRGQIDKTIDYAYN